ncbi:MAG: hypothetical protein KGM16_05420 [Bacteroidota bacterium]|nr:hypothetical protein [Bacteroidota bacterium]
MEIPEITLTESLRLSQTSSLHVGLNNLLQKLEANKIEDFLKGEKLEEISKIDQELYQILLNTIHYSQNKVEEISQIIFTEKHYLITGISNGDVKSILVFLSVNCYLQIEIEKLLTENDLAESNTKPLSENILKLLLNVKIETHALPNAPYHEKKIMQESKDGFADNDIKRTYELIESIERGGRGFHFNFLLENLISFFSSISFPYFVKALSVIRRPQTFVFYLQSFKTEKLNQLSYEPSLTNKWLNFELIRQIVAKNKDENFIKKECFAIKNCLLKIEAEDFEFFKQVIQFFNSSIIFNASLGELVASLSDEKIYKTVDCFEIDKYSSHQIARNNFLKSFTANCSEQKQEALLKRVYENWSSFLNSLFSMDDFYQNDLLITDFADFVLQYYTILVAGEEILRQLEIVMSKIIYIDSEWSISESQHLTKFHLYHSQLYLLSYAYRNKKLNYAQTLQTFSELKQNTIQIQRYFKHAKTNQFEMMEENFNWLSPKSQL